MKKQINKNMAGSLWFRESEFEQLQHLKIIKTIRLGDRSCATDDLKGGYCEGQIIELKIVKDDNITFLPWKVEALIESVDYKKIKDIKRPDFDGCLDGLCDSVGLLASFRRFYGQEFSGEELVSIITLKQLA